MAESYIKCNETRVLTATNLTIYEMVKSVPQGFSIFKFYNAPADVPQGKNLSNWNYNLTVFKTSGVNEISAYDYCILFYPRRLFIGNFIATETIEWKEIQLS